MGWARITDGGTPEIITREQAAEEIDSAINGPLRSQVPEMSANKTGATLRYLDGRKVEIRPATPEECPVPVETNSEGLRIITVEGKRYVVGALRQGWSRTADGSWFQEPHVPYWTEKNGLAYGPLRNTCASRKVGTVGRAVWDVVNAN